MFETERLFLRKFKKADTQDVFELRSDAEMMRFIRQPQSRAESENWIRLISSRWEKENIGFCAVVEKSSNKFIGWCGLWRLVETDEIEVGYAIDKKFWGKGYATEAAEKFLEYGFEKLNLEKIVAVARPENTASRRVMEKIGMTFNGLGKFYGADLVHYSINKRDWMTTRRGDIAKTLNLES